MENYSRVNELAAKSVDMVGTAEQKYGAVLDSIEAKVAQFQDSWTTLINNLNQSGTFKGVVDSGTKIIEMLDTILNKMGGFQAITFGAAIFAFTKLGEATSKLSGNITNSVKNANTFIQTLSRVKNASAETKDDINKLGNMVKGLSANQQATILAMKGLTNEQIRQQLEANDLEKELIEAAMATKQFAMAQKSATKDSGGFTSTLVGIGESIGITSTQVAAFGNAMSMMGSQADNALGMVASGLGSALSAGVKFYTGDWVGGTMDTIMGIYNLIQTYERMEEAHLQSLIDKGNDVRQSYDDQKSTIESNISTLESLRTEYEELSKGVDDYGRNITLSTEEYSRYNEIVDQIVELSPSLQGAYFNENGLLRDKNELLKKAIEYQRQQRLEEMKAATTSDKMQEMVEGKVAQATKNLEEERDRRKEILNDIAGDFSGFGISAGDVAKGLSEVLGVDIQNYSADMVANIWNAFNKYGPQIEEKSKEIEEAIKRAVQANEYAEYNDENFKNFMNAFQTNTEEFNRLYAERDRERKNALSDLDKKGDVGKLELIGPEDTQEQQQAINTLLDMYISFQKETEGIVNEISFGKFEVDTEKLGTAEKNVDDFIDKLKGNVESGGQSIKDVFAEIFTLDPSEMSVGEYKNKVQEVIDKVASAIQTEDDPIDWEQELKLYLGVSTIGPDGVASDNIETGIDKLTAYFGEELRSKFEGLSAEEYNILIRIMAELDPNSDFSEIERAIELEMAELEPKLEIGAILTDAMNSIEATTSALDTLNSVADEFSKNGNIAAGTWKKLIESDLLKYIEFTSDGLRVNTQELANNAQQTQQNYQQQLLLAYAEEMVRINALTEEEAVAELGGTTEEVDRKARILTETTSALAQVNFLAATSFDVLRAAEDGSGISFENNSAKQRLALNAANDLISGMNILTSAFNSVGTAANGASSAISNLKSQLQGFRNSIEDLLGDTISMLKQEANDRKKAINDQIKALDKRYKAEKEALQNLKKNKDDAYKKEKEQINDLKKAENDRWKKQKEALDNELDAYKEKIQAEKDLLKLKDEERKYEKELAEKRNDVSKIQNDLAALEFDNSVEAQKKKLELAQELAEKQEELDEFQYDRDIELQEKALDDELDRYTKAHEAKLKALEDEHNKYLENLEARLEGIEDEKEAWDDLYQSRLDALEDNYNAQKEALQDQLQAIQDYLDDEYAIRLEAMALMEGKTDEFYQRLLEWNRKYGTGVTLAPFVQKCA